MPKSDIIDNQEEKLVDHLKPLIKGSQRAKFAIGYFFISGFKNIIKDIENLDELKMIIGSTTNRETYEAMAIGYTNNKQVEDKIREKKYLTADLEKAELQKSAKKLEGVVAGVKQTDANEVLIKKVVSLIKNDKLKIRIYLKATLHAKAYIFDYPKGKQYESGNAIIGSSNLSYSGQNSNTELNVVVPGKANHQELSKWFNDLWKEAEDFDKELLQVLEGSWAVSQPTPYQVYLKVLYELFKDRLSDPVELEGKADIPKLYDFQKDAVAQALSILDRYHGVFLADVVGLGKTYVAAAMIRKYLDKEGGRAIVVCPPKLRSTWKKIARRDFNTSTEVFSSGDTEKLFDDDILKEKTKLVVIDESHHFKNPSAVSYENMADFCYGKDVILVSATPYNISAEDIKNQIKLFHPQDITEIPVDPPRLSTYFKMIKKGERQLKDILWELIVRRTRNDIENNPRYEKDMKRSDLRFPDRHGPYRIDYSIDKVYPEKIYDEITNRLKKLEYARYNLGSFVKAKYAEEDEIKQLGQIGPQLRAMMKAMTLKRLESSVEAFKVTINNFHQYLKFFLDQLENNKVVAGVKSDELYRAVSSEEEFDTTHLEEKNRKKYPIEKFKVDELTKKIKHDMEILEEIKGFVDPITEEEDEKLKELESQLKSNEFSGKEKILIFSQFETTVRYVGEYLKSKFDKVEFVSGSTHKIMDKVKRFAPKANQATIKKAEEIKIMVATDTLSEGVNMQDANVVVNYDLHWNPVKLIQRIGRIDRVTTGHDDIYVHNFFPERGLEKELGIEERISRRIKEIHENLGADAKLLSQEENISDTSFAKLYQGKYEIIEEQEVSVAFEKYVQLLANIKETNPKLFDQIKKLSPKIRTAKFNKTPKGVVGFFKYGDFNKFYHANKSGKVKELKREDALKIMQSKKTTSRQELPEHFNSVVRMMEQQFEKNMIGLEQDLDDKENEPIISQIFKRLDQYSRGESNAFKKKVGRLKDEIIDKDLSMAMKSKMRKLKSYEEVNKDEFIVKLREIINNAKKLSNQKQASNKYVQIVASEALK